MDRSHPATTPEAVHAEVGKAVIDRRGRYGEPADFCTRVAKRWSLTLGVTVEPWQVPVLMNDFKVERIIGNPFHVDSWVDGGGYMIMGPSVVQATVTVTFGEGAQP